MSHIVRLVVVIAFCLQGLWLVGPSSAATNPSTRPAAARRVVARWYGQMSGIHQTYASREPGALGLSMSRPNMQQQTQARVVIREEVDDLTAARHAVVESLAWSSSVGDLYYLNKDGSRVRAGGGGGGSGSYGEHDLLGEPVPPSPEQLADLRQRVEQAQQDVQQARHDYEKARQEARANDVDPAGVPLQGPQKELIESLRSYQALQTQPGATDEQIEAAQHRVERARQQYQKHLDEQHKQIEQTYTEKLQPLVSRLQDTKLSDEERRKAGEELTRLSEQLARESQKISAASGVLSHMQELDRLAQKLAAAERYLRIAQQDLEELLNHRASRASADARVEYDRALRRWRTDLSFGVEDKQLIEFEADVIPLKLVGFKTVLRDQYEPTTMVASVARNKGLFFSGQGDFPEEKGIVLSRNEQYENGSPGLIGGGRGWSQATFRRVPTEQQLVVQGTILHRIRIPRDEKDLNLVRYETLGPAAPGSPTAAAVSLEGALPVAGKVKVEAWLLDANGSPASNVPPDITVYTRENQGEFSLAVPADRNKRLFLRFTYHNRDAQLWETNELAVEIERIYSAVGADAQGDAPLDDIVRSSTAYFRYGKAPMEYPLGSELRGASVRREDSTTTLRFAGFNSILINSFILKTPYLNQNRHPFEVKAKVPAAKLLAARPAHISEATVRARMRLPASGSVPDESEIDVPIRGSVLCFPTSVAMSLAGIGLFDIPDGAQHSDHVSRIASEIYQHYRTQYSKMPEMFPFPTDPAIIDRIAQESSVPPPYYLLGANLMYWANWTAMGAAYGHWPFVSGTQQSMEWLISLKHPTAKLNLTLYGRDGTKHALSLDTENYRPWQWAWITDSYVRKTYGSEAFTYDTPSEPYNVFAADSAKLVNVLGHGWGSVVSIGHRSSTGQRGGHLIALVGLITDCSGNVVRWIFHDPYGDQSRNPGIPGYYDPAKVPANYDQDPPQMQGEPATWGRYAPYGPEINSWNGRLEGRFWEIFKPRQPETGSTMRKRLLPSQSSPRPPGR